MTYVILEFGLEHDIKKGGLTRIFYFQNDQLAINGNKPVHLSESNISEPTRLEKSGKQCQKFI